MMPRDHGSAPPDPDHPEDKAPGRDDQLPFDLSHRPARDRDAFCVSPSNEAAVAMIDAWPRGWTMPWALLCGPAGAGKTHLAHVWATRAGAVVRSVADLTVAAVPRLVAGGPLVLELGDPPLRDQPALFHLINLVREQGGALLLTARSHPAGWGLERADLASRLRAMPMVELGAPDDDTLRAVLAKLFQDRQIAIDPGVIDYLTLRMERSFARAQALVERLDRLALVRKRPVTTRLALEVLAEFDGTDPQGPESLAP